jgi:hypothetical protein
MGPSDHLTIPFIEAKNLPLCLLNGIAIGAAPTSLPHPKARTAMLPADKARK